MIGTISKRGIFWSKNVTPSLSANLLTSDEEMLIMKYRGQIQDFSQNYVNFEKHMQGS